MVSKKNNPQSAPIPDGGVRSKAKAADHVNRAKAIATTVWHAMQNSGELTENDIGALADTLYEAILRLAEAEKDLNVYHVPLIGEVA
ncbi:hypothetical protein [Pelagibacterium sediminicola]|uniref:hypothetical protein n=1 Tax=Pelagibacterium sediminicola TaxID=2248761 RepID=UPI000E31C70C|nr:hypothetical protein [Pelagibacterium sediminicola]